MSIFFIGKSCLRRVLNYLSHTYTNLFVNFPSELLIIFAYFRIQKKITHKFKINIIVTCEIFRKFKIKRVLTNYLGM